MEVAQLINWWHLWGEIVLLVLDAACIVLVLVLSKLRNNKVWWWLSPMIVLTLLIIPDLVNKRNVVNTLFWLSFASSIAVLVLFVIYLFLGDWKAKKEEEIAEVFPNQFVPNISGSAGGEKTAAEVENLSDTVGEVSLSEEPGEEEKTRIVKKTTPVFAWLVGMSGKNKGKDFDLNEDITSIGRSSGNDVIIDDDSVSKEHAKIKYFEDNDKYKLYDLVSTNGTSVNGKQIEIPTEIKDGDEIEFGEAMFVFKSVERRDVKRKEGEGNEKEKF